MNRVAASGDFDQDGDADLVVMRGDTAAGATDVLLMNVGGVLTEMTSTLAVATNVVGSAAFFDLTDDNDVTVADVTGDGWLDVVTAAATYGPPVKYLTHPRVYINRGLSSSGQWQGFIFDDEDRIPTFPLSPQFVSVAAGDIDVDGDIDLIFGTFAEPLLSSTNNHRLLLNNGTGFFTDVSPLRLPLSIQDSGTTNSIALVDMNGDGLLDIVKDQRSGTNFPFASVVTMLNGIPSPGYFLGYEPQSYITLEVRGTAVDDFDADGRKDVFMAQTGLDAYFRNLTPQGTSTFVRGPFEDVVQVGTAVDNFPGARARAADFNRDGLPEVISCNRSYYSTTSIPLRAHLFRNRGTPTATLIEEEFAGFTYGIPITGLANTFDAGILDIDGNGRLDLVLCRNGATDIWLSQSAAELEFSFPGGRPAYQSASGSTPITVDIVTTSPLSQLDSSSVRLWSSIDGSPFTSGVMTNTSGSTFVGNLPTVTSCYSQIRYYIEAKTTAPGAMPVFAPSSAPTLTMTVSGAVGISSSVVQSFQSSVAGWTVVNSPGLSSGAWQQATPSGTYVGFYPSVPVAPGRDSEPLGTQTKCFVTQNAPAGSTSTAADVDQGETTLISPLLDLSGCDAIISYDRWFFAPMTRYFLIEITGDGTNWVQVESVQGFQGETNMWVARAFRVSDFIVPTSTVQMRFRASDIPESGAVEAGIDRFVVTKLAALEFCQPNLGYGGPGNLTLSVCGGDLSSGTTAELQLSSAIPQDVAYLLGSFTADLVPVFGGVLVSANPFFIGSVPTDAMGQYVDPNIPGGLGNVSVYLQALQVDGSLPELIAFSNIVRLDFLP